MSAYTRSCHDIIENMAQENVALIKSMYEAFGRGDIPFVLSALDPKVVWNEAENFIYADGNPYVGPQSVLNGVFTRLGTEWRGFSATPEEFLDAGDTVVVRGRYRGIYIASGASLDAQFAHVFTMRAGKVARFQQYTDTAQARDVVSRGAKGA
jgi:ketosteroid isomerase-like protein